MNTSMPLTQTRNRGGESEEVSSQAQFNEFCTSAGCHFEGPLTPVAAAAMIAKYDKVHTCFLQRFPAMSNALRMEWAVKYTLNPELFSDAFSTRINNVMLVAALLVTVTVSFFLEPPERSSGSELTYYVWVYANFLATACFLGSILLGIVYTENAMSRTYTESDRICAMVAGIRWKNLAKRVLMMGVFLLVCSLAIAAVFLYSVAHAIAVGALSAAFVAVVVYSIAETHLHARAAQRRRIKVFASLVLEGDGRAKRGILDMVAKINNNQEQSGTTSSSSSGGGDEHAQSRPQSPNIVHQSSSPPPPVPVNVTATVGEKGTHALWASSTEYRILESIRLLLGVFVILFFTAIVILGVANSYSVLQLPPAANFLLLAIALLILAYAEALRYGVVAVEKWGMAPYADLYPRAAKLHLLVDTPSKVKKFLVGRQFLVVLVVFVIAQITTFPHIPHDFAGMPEPLVLVLVQTGLPGVAVTLTFGQLVSQLFVEEFTLPCLDMPGCQLVVRLSLAAEHIGVCSFSWLSYYACSNLCYCRIVRARGRILEHQRSAVVGTDPDSPASPMSPTALNRGPDFDLGVEPAHCPTTFGCFKYLWSTAASLGSVALICYGISKGEAVLPVPAIVSFLVLLCTLVLMYHVEGLMIAVAAVQLWDRETFLTAYPRAYKLHVLVTRPDNMKRFIIGRQFCTVLLLFLIAQVTTFPNWQQSSSSVDPTLFFIAVRSGLAGVLVTLCFGQLLPELLASEFPLKFLNMAPCYCIVQLALAMESMAVGHSAWVVFYGIRALLCGAGTGAGERGNLSNGYARNSEDHRPTVVRVKSPELLHKTGCPYGVGDISERVVTINEL